MLSDSIVAKPRSKLTGQAMRITNDDLHDAFPSHLLIDPSPAEDQLLEKLPGANYGQYLLTKNLLTQDYTLTCHECGTTRVRNDWDRR